MKVSIIIPVFNEEKVIGECLDSLKNQTFKDFELIMVDDGSTDKTLDILNSFKLLPLTVLKQNHKGPGAARNLGSHKALGDILVFVDADMTFDLRFIQKLIDPIIKGKTKGTFSKEEFVANWENSLARCWSINENWMPKRRHPYNYPDKQAVFRAILKSEFEKVGGFTPGGYNDDWSLSSKLGYLADNAPGAIFYHKNPSTLSEIYSQAKWVGKRDYKLGVLGAMIALVRASLPFSLIIGFSNFVVKGEPIFVVFKVVYDFGIFVGIIDYLFGNKAK